LAKVYCPECGHQNTEGGKYCSKCGALLPEDDVSNQSTIKYKLDTEEKESETSRVDDVVKEGVSLVVRSGGGRAGEMFSPSGEQSSIGRSPGSDFFLDDITVSRNHALLLRKHDGFYIQDQGSLNGTYVNRVRVETQKLFDGDQLQIGKYKLTFIEK
jgi:hypothetical protein